jgi:hypothetical protein
MMTTKVKPIEIGKEPGQHDPSGSVHDHLNQIFSCLQNMDVDDDRLRGTYVSSAMSATIVCGNLLGVKVVGKDW